ncbi:hypothetical protein EV126DRAFT_427794 [Verticillium dahliae]|nr:hypothetical protein EV126DRAFT_427794 [Verticillium dahliae]
MTWGFGLLEVMSLPPVSLKTKGLHKPQCYGRSRANLAANSRYLLEKNNQWFKETARAVDEPELGSEVVKLRGPRRSRPFVRCRCSLRGRRRETSGSRAETHVKGCSMWAICFPKRGHGVTSPLLGDPAHRLSPSWMCCVPAACLFAIVALGVLGLDRRRNQQGNSHGNDSGSNFLIAAPPKQLLPSSSFLSETVVLPAAM